MKKLLSLFVVILMAISTMVAAPLKIEGVDIVGSSASIAMQLQNKGFNLVTLEDNVILMEGTVAKYADCRVGIVGDLIDPITYKVAVIFPRQTEWADLYANFSAIKKLLVAKYGQPTNDYEQWDSAIYPEDDTYRMYEVILDQCKFVANWETEQGKIEVMISGGWDGRCVLLNYFPANQVTE